MLLNLNFEICPYAVPDPVRRRRIRREEEGRYRRGASLL
jgi:hypothetical protein